MKSRTKFDPALFQSWGGFSSGLSALFWAGIALIYLPATTYFRFNHLSNPLFEEFIPVRQFHTSITTYYFAQNKIGFLNYQSPLNGNLWNFVMEFPLYQWLSAQLMHTGLSLEAASRIVCLVFFFSSAVAFFKLVALITDRQTAFWSVLFYVICPMSVTYSRVALIDFTAQGLSMVSLWALAEYLLTRKTILWLLFAFICGALASTIKITVWYIPAAFFILIMIYFRKTLHTNPLRAYQATGCLVLQGVVAVSWLAWTHHLHGFEYFGVSSTPKWYFGSVTDRFSLDLWRANFLRLSMDIFNLWMLIPFCFGIFLSKKYRSAVNFSASILVVGLVVLFTLHARHAWYWIPELPFVIFVAAVGMVQLLEKRTLLARGLIITLLAALAVRTVRFPYLFTHTFTDMSPRLSEYHLIKESTSAEDIIYADLSMERQDLPLYTQRLMALAPMRPKLVSGSWPLQPSIFLFEKGKVDLALLQGFDPIWLNVPLKTLIAYRVGNAKQTRLDPMMTISVTSNHTIVERTMSSVEKTLLVDLCGKEKDFEVISTSRARNEIQVRALPQGDTFQFPARKYLFLPARSKIYGCRFEVSIDPVTT